MKRDHALIVLLALVIAGYVGGRISTRHATQAPGVAADAAAAQTVTAQAPTTSEPTSAAAPSAMPAPSAPTAAPSAPADPNQVWRVQIHADDPKLGPDSALVKVVVFSAFGCPECSDFAPAIAKAAKEYGDKVQFRFKQKVIAAPHPDAATAAEASLAANAQGKFWPFHDKLMASQAIDRGTMESVAAGVGLDVARFKKDLDSGKFRGQVLRDSLLANEVAANTFPNILANGVRIKPPKNFDQLKVLIDEQLVKAKSAVASGTPAARLYESTVSTGKFFEQTGGPAVQFQTQGSPVKGNPTAKITVVLFEDFQCPFCSKLSPSIEAFQKRFPNDVKVIYKHMPLTIHDNAQIAAEASMAAAAQGKFWEYHDILFANQQALTQPDLERYAQQAGLDVNKFKADLAAGVGKQLIQRDNNEGGQAGVTGTPSVFINGMRYQGPRGYPPEGLEAVARVYFGL